MRQQPPAGKVWTLPNASARSIAVLPFVNQSGNADDEYFSESVAVYQRLQSVLGGEPLTGLAITYARTGKTMEARGILKEILERAERKYVSPDLIAVIYASLGEMDQAFAWLDRAYEARSGFMITGILVSPDYDPLRSDPRFDALLRKIGLKK